MSIGKKYDFELAKYIIEAEKPKGLKVANMGMYEDWFWTAQEVWNKEGGYAKELHVIKEIAGISGSDWATPVLHLEYEDQRERYIACFLGKEGDSPDKKKQAICVGFRCNVWACPAGYR